MTDILKENTTYSISTTTSVLTATIKTKRTATKTKKKTTILTTTKKKIITTFKKKKSKEKQRKGKIRLPSLCHICQNEFTGPNDLRKHLRIHTGEKPFRCTECNQCFRQSGTLKNHKASQHGTTVQFICAHCNKSFPIKERLRLHMRIHSGEKPYQCDYCRKTFARGGQLKQHLITHYPLNNVLTRIKKSSSTSSSTSASSHTSFGKETKHLTTSTAAAAAAAAAAAIINNNNDRRQYLCTICNKHFSREILFKKHIKLKHSGDDDHDDDGDRDGDQDQNDNMIDTKVFHCHICEKTVKGHLAQHMQIHQKNTKQLIGCVECGATFSQRCQLIVHQRIHTGERPYRCEVCWKAFAYSYVLKLHIRKHTGEKPFNCPVCIANGVAFAQLSHLKTHMRAIHNMDKTYMCHGCKEFFKIKNELQCHMLMCVDYKNQNQNPNDQNDENVKNPINTLNVEDNIATYRCFNDAQMMTRSLSRTTTGTTTTKPTTTTTTTTSTTGMTITKMRMLIAMLLKKILTTERLHKLGYEKRLIDNVLIDSLKIAGQKYCDGTGMGMGTGGTGTGGTTLQKKNLNEFECLKCNVEFFLKWTVPSEYMKKYTNDDKHSIEQLLEDLATRFNNFGND